MSMMKQQVEQLAKQVTGDITITNELMEVIANHNIRQSTNVCWCWNDENGNDVCGGIGALSNFINNDCTTIRWTSVKNHVRLAINGNAIWTTNNGG